MVLSNIIRRLALREKLSIREVSRLTGCGALKPLRHWFEQWPRDHKAFDCRHDRAAIHNAKSA
jgi:hypothetical protein